MLTLTQGPSPPDSPSSTISEDTYRDAEISAVAPPRPQNVVLHFIFIKAHLLAGRYTEALQEALKLEQMVLSVRSPEYTARLRLWKGVAQMMLGETDEARRNFVDALYEFDTLPQSEITTVGSTYSRKMLQRLDRQDRRMGKHHPEKAREAAGWTSHVADTSTELLALGVF